MKVRSDIHLTLNPGLIDLVASAINRIGPEMGYKTGKSCVTRVEQPDMEVDGIPLAHVDPPGNRLAIKPIQAESILIQGIIHVRMRCPDNEFPAYSFCRMIFKGEIPAGIRCYIFKPPVASNVETHLERGVRLGLARIPVNGLTADRDDLIAGIDIRISLSNAVILGESYFRSHGSGQSIKA